MAEPTEPRTLIEDEFGRFQLQEGWRHRGWDIADGLLTFLADAGWALVPIADSSPPSPAQHPGQTVDDGALSGRPLFSTRQVMLKMLRALGEDVDEGELIRRIDDGLRLWDVVDRLLADLDAARQSDASARAALSIVEENFHELEAERDRMRPVVEALAAWINEEDPMDIRAVYDAYRTYETQENTDADR